MADLFHSSLYFLDCSNLSLINITVQNGHGTGAALFNTVGTVNIVDCSFVNNIVRSSHYPGGGGLYIEFTDCTPEMLGKQCIVKDRYPDSNYTIQNCFFLNNKASTFGNVYIHPQGPFQGFGKGGGLAIYLNGNTKQCTITIVYCHFQNNSAFGGGGIFTMFRGSPSYNSITVKDSGFITNKVVHREGGGRFHKSLSLIHS